MKEGNQHPRAGQPTGGQNSMQRRGQTPEGAPRKRQHARSAAWTGLQEPANPLLRPLPSWQGDSALPGTLRAPPRNPILPRKEPETARAGPGRGPGQGEKRKHRPAHDTRSGLPISQKKEPSPGSLHGLQASCFIAKNCANWVSNLWEPGSGGDGIPAQKSMH